VLAERFEARAQEAQNRAELIRRALLNSATDEQGGREIPISPEEVA
jgi:hypothetical protein